MSNMKKVRVCVDIDFKCERMTPQEQTSDVLTAVTKLEPVILKAITDNAMYGPALVDYAKVEKVEFPTAAAMNLDGLRDFFRENNMGGFADHVGQFGRVSIELDPEGGVTVRFGA